MDGDVMEIDTHPQTHVHAPPKPPHASPEETLLALLKMHLTPFIIRQITQALGPEYVSLYGPPPNASPKVLLDILQSRWVAVFSDSVLCSSEQLIARLREAVSTHTPIPQLAMLIEDLLLTIKKPDAAAQAACFRRRNPSRTQVQPSTPATLPRTPIVATTNSTTSHNHLQVDTQMTNGQHKFLVVLDGSNIAFRHGKMKRFSLTGILIVREYYISRNHRTITFVPEYRVQRQTPLYDLPDVVQTPSKDYDDAYIVNYARTHMGVVVSNDKFRDVVYQASAESQEAATQWKEWLSASCIGYTFHEDTFLPNPAFNWDRAAKAAVELRLQE